MFNTNKNKTIGKSKILSSLKKRKNKNVVKVCKSLLIIKQKHKLTFKNKFDINLRSNNIFFTFSLLQQNKILVSGSSGSYKIKTTKKRMNQTYKKLLSIFMNKVRKESIDVKKKGKDFNIYDSLIVTVSAKKILHKRILKKLKKFGQRIKKNRSNSVVVIIKAKKCFNGCRVSKKRRQKRIKFRLFG